MKYSSLILVLFAFILSSCKKEGIDISGYTRTDAQGNFSGNIDQSDWTFATSWKNSETEIFNNIASGDLANTTAGTIIINPAYPNPCTNHVALTIVTTTACKLRFALVNENLNTLTSNTVALVAGSNNFMIALPQTPGAYRSGELYRLYYVFDAAGSPIFKKGHGDILIQ